MPRNDAAAAGHVCSGIRIHIIDIVQPPGIAISPIADMDTHQTVVNTALAAKSSAETAKKAWWDARSGVMRCRSALVVLVVAAPPEARLVATLGRAVEPLVHAPETVQPARIREIGVVDDAVLERERAHARRLSRIRCNVGPDRGRHFDDWTLRTLLRRRAKSLWAEVVHGDSRPLLLLRVARLEVVVEVGSERRCPGEAPTHPAPVRQDLRDRRARDGSEGNVVVGQVDDRAVEAIGNRGTRRTAGRVVGPEHEVGDEELRTPSEEVCQRGAPLLGIEFVLLVDPDPRQLLPAPRQPVAAPRQLLFRLKQLEPRRKPLFTCPGLLLGHRSSPYVSLRRTPSSVRPRRPIAPRSGRGTALLSPGVCGSGPTPAHAPGGRGARAPRRRVRGGDA